MKVIVTGDFLACLVDKNNEFTRAMANYEVSKASVVFVTIPAILEFVNIMLNEYRVNWREIQNCICQIISKPNVVCDQNAINAGLSYMGCGVKLVDGITNHEGKIFGADAIISCNDRLVFLSNILYENGNYIKPAGPRGILFS